MSHRLACLHVPLFPLAARLRSEPELRDQATVVVEGNGNAARVAAATRRARRAGIGPGMTLPQARALLPNLAARGRDPQCERAAQDALLEISERFSPRLEDAGEGVVYLEIDGLERHFPGNSPEQDLAHAITTAASRADLPTWIGIASSKLAARIAAELPSSPTFVPPGQEAHFLAPLPLCRLSVESSVLETLQRWGIQSIGDFAHLPANEVASRLGETGHRLHEKARGLDTRPLVPYQPPTDFREGMDLEWPLTSLEPFVFIARAALSRLCQRLSLRGFACTRLDLMLRLEPDGAHHRSLQLPAPTREVKTLLTLLRLDLEKNSPGAPVTGFVLIAYPDRPRETQLSLFGPPSLSPDKLATTLARLFVLLGSGRVGSPCADNTHRPGADSLVAYQPPPPPEVRPPARQGRGLLAIRILRPPVPLEVMTHPTAGPSEETAVPATPRELLSIVRDDELRRPVIQGGVKVASGPWKLEDSWWSCEAVQRDYWDIELTDGGLYRIFHQRQTGEWFADGIYD